MKRFVRAVFVDALGGEKDGDYVVVVVAVIGVNYYICIVTIINLIKTKHYVRHRI